MALTHEDYGFTVDGDQRRCAIRWLTEDIGKIHRVLTLGFGRPRACEATLHDGFLIIGKKRWKLDELADMRIENRHVPMRTGDTFVMRLSCYLREGKEWALVADPGARKIEIARQLSEVRATYLGELIMECIEYNSTS